MDGSTNYSSTYMSGTFSVFVLMTIHTERQVRWNGNEIGCFNWIIEQCKYRSARRWGKWRYCRSCLTRRLGIRCWTWIDFFKRSGLQQVCHQATKLEYCIQERAPIVNWWIQEGCDLTRRGGLYELEGNVQQVQGFVSWTRLSLWALLYGSIAWWMEEQVAFFHIVRLPNCDSKDFGQGVECHRWRSTRTCRWICWFDPVHVDFVEVLQRLPSRKLRGTLLSFWSSWTWYGCDWKRNRCLWWIDPVYVHVFELYLVCWCLVWSCRV